PAAAPAAAAAAPAAAAASPDEMVVIDAIVMRVSENGTTTKGSNILDTFSVTLAPGTHMYGRGKTLSATGDGSISSGVFAASGDFPATGAFSSPVGTGLSVSRVFTQGISFGNVTYSLKIA